MAFYIAERILSFCGVWALAAGCCQKGICGNSTPNVTAPGVWKHSLTSCAVKTMQILSGNGILTAILVLILGLIIVYTNFVLSVYLSISVGQIPKFNKHRSGIGVIAFFLINIIIGYVRSFINNIMPQNVWDGVENSLSSILDNSIFTMNKCYWFMIITDIAIIGLLFYGINFILSKKLNLE